MLTVFSSRPVSDYRLNPAVSLVTRRWLSCVHMQVGRWREGKTSGGSPALVVVFLKMLQLKEEKATARHGRVDLEYEPQGGE